MLRHGSVRGRPGSDRAGGRRLEPYRGFRGQSISLGPRPGGFSADSHAVSILRGRVCVGIKVSAAGIRGTGIGCFFDDAMHDLLGLRDRRWQSLYHFTVGGPVLDPRLQTLPPYAHLAAKR